MPVSRKYLVYIVDDDPVYLKSMEKCIQSKDLSVKTCSTGEIFLNRLYKKPDIAILDYHLNSKHLNGLKLLQNVKTQLPDTAVVMISSDDKLEIAVNTIKYGAIDYIVKNESSLIRLKNILQGILLHLRTEAAHQAYKRKMKWMFITAFFIFVTSILIQFVYPQLFCR